MNSIVQWTNYVYSMTSQKYYKMSDNNFSFCTSKEPAIMSDFTTHCMVYR